MQERQRSWFVVLVWVSCSVQTSFMCCRTGVGRNRIFCNGCKHWVHKKCSGIKCLAKDPDCRCTQCQGTACLLDSRPHREVPSRTWQAGGGSFLLLPGRHALSSRWLWTLNHNTCENHLEEVPRSCYWWTLPASSFSRHVAVCTGVVWRAQCSMPVRLGHWQSQTSNVCNELTGQWSDR